MGETCFYICLKCKTVDQVSYGIETTEFLEQHWGHFVIFVNQHGEPDDIQVFQGEWDDE